MAVKQAGHLGLRILPADVLNDILRLVCLQLPSFDAMPAPFLDTNSTRWPVRIDHASVYKLPLVSREFFRTYNTLLWRHIRINTLSSLQKLHAALRYKPINGTLVISLHLGELADPQQTKFTTLLAKEVLCMVPHLQNLSIDGIFRNGLLSDIELKSLRFLCVGERLHSREDDEGNGGDEDDDYAENEMDGACDVVFQSTAKLPALEDLRVCGPFHTRCIVNSFNDAFIGEHDAQLPALTRSTWDLGSSSLFSSCNAAILRSLFSEVAMSSTQTRPQRSLRRGHHTVTVMIDGENLGPIMSLVANPERVMSNVQPHNNDSIQRRHSIDVVALETQEGVVTMERVRREFQQRNQQWWEEHALQLQEEEDP